MSFSEGIVNHIGGQIVLHLTCTMIFSVDPAHYRVSCSSGHCGTCVVIHLNAIALRTA